MVVLSLVETWVPRHDDVYELLRLLRRIVASGCPSMATSSDGKMWRLLPTTGVMIRRWGESKRVRRTPGGMTLIIYVFDVDGRQVFAHYHPSRRPSGWDRWEFWTE